MKLLFCILSLLSTHLFPNGFTTLKEFTDYALTVPEYPENDSLNWDDPDFVKFHQQMQPSLKKRLISWLRLQSIVTFPIDKLPGLLEEVTQNLQKVSPPGRLVKKIFVDTGASFYIWGELNGAFHSLVRSLNELVRLGLLDNNLKVLDPKVHLVFIGDILNKSPYLIETAFLILRLMQVNPRCPGRGHDTIFYLKGKIEDKQEWLSAGLARELQTRYAELGSEKIPLKSEFSDFFNSVPLAIYIMPEEQTAKEREAVRISYFGPGYAELDEDAFMYLFDDYAKPVISVTQKNFQESTVSLKIRAYIYAGGSLKKRIRQRGLSLIAKKSSGLEWTVFSSPTSSSRRLFEFFDDAFVKLAINDGKKLSSWTLTLFREDVRTLNGFVKERPFYLLSGEVIPDERQQKVVELQNTLADLLSANQSLKKNCVLVQSENKVADEKKVDKSVSGAISALQDGNFVIGSTMDLTRQLKGYSELLKQGLNLVIDQENQSGGIGGKKIRMVYLDDGYEAQKARINIEKFLNDIKTNVTLSSMGTVTISGYLDLIRAKKVLAIFPNTGSFRSPDLTYLLHLKTSYIENGHVIAQFMSKTLKDKKIAFFYQDDAWGKDLLKGAKYEFVKAGTTKFLDLPYVSNSISFAEQAAELKKFDPDGIALFCTPRVCQELIKELGVEFLRQKILFGDTVLGLKEFNEYLREKGLTVTRVQAMPNPQTSQLEIVKNFREDASKANVPIDSTSLEGYMNAAVFIDLMNKIKNDFSIENFIKAFEGIKNYDFKGLKLNFDPETRQLLHTVWINNGTDDWLPQEVAIDKVVYDSTSEISVKAELMSGPATIGAKSAAEKDALAEQKKAQERLKSADDTLSSLQGKELKIGSTMDLSKGVKGLSDGYKKGMMLKLEEINASGGVNGIVFQLNILDDQYEPPRARTNVLDLINNLQIDLLLAPLGTPTTQAYLDLIEQGKVLALFPIARSLEFRRPDLINIIQYQMSLNQEADMITRYIYEKYQPKRIVIFYQNDNFGIEPKDEIERLIKNEYPKVELLVIPYERNNVNFKAQIEKVKNFKPDAFALQATSSVVEEFIRQIGTTFLHGKILFGGSWLMVDQFLKSIKEKGLEINLVSSVPDPISSEIQLVQEFRKAADAKDEALNVIHLEGYLYMSLLAYAMQQIEAPYSKEKIINVFQNMKNYDFKGLKLNFNPETRVILQDAWIYSTKDNSWTQRSISEIKSVKKAEKPLEAEKESKTEEQKKEKLQQKTEAKEQISKEPIELTSGVPVVKTVLLPINEQPLSSIQDNVLKIGSTMDLSKSVKAVAEGYKSGIMLQVNALNDAGGINGMHIRYDALDDGYDAARGRSNVLKLLNDDKIDLLLSPIGSEPLRAILDIIEQKKVLALFPVAKFSGIRRPDLINIINYQSSAAEELSFMTKYMLETYGMKSLVIFYQNDVLGVETSQAIERLLKSSYPNVTFALIEYERNNVNFSEQMQKIKSLKPDGIAFIAMSSVIEELVRQLGVDFLFGRKLYAGSWTIVDQLLSFLKSKGLDIIFASFVPDPLSSQSELAKEFRALAEKNNITVNSVELEGFLYMSLLADVLKKMEKPITQAKIIKAFEQMKNYDFKGIKLNFNPATREIFQDVWIYSTKDNSWTQRSISEIKDIKKEEPKEPKVEEPKIEEPQQNVEVKEPVVERQSEANPVVLELNQQPLSSIQDNVLKIGSTMDLTKGVKAQSEGYKGGMLLKMNDVNHAGGVKGMSLQLSILDDGYEPARARSNILSLIENSKIDLFMAPLGTPIFQSYLDLVREGKILVLFPIARAREFRQPDLINVIQYQPSAGKESEIIARYVMKKNKILRTAIFYQNDNFGQESAAAIKKVLKEEFKSEDVLDVMYDRNTTDFRQQVEKIREYKPDAIAFATTPATNEEIIRSLKPDFLFGKVLYGGSWLMVDSFIKFIKEKGLDINLVSLSPDPVASDAQIAQEFRILAEKTNTPINSIYLDGFLYMSLFVHVLEGLEKPISKQKIIDAFEKMKDYDFKGIQLNFNPETREIIKNVWIYSVKNNTWIEQAVNPVQSAPEKT